MSSAVYGKTIGNLKNRIDVRLARNKKDYLKRTPKPSHMSQKTFVIDLVVICKSKVPLTFNKAACVGMCILDLSKVLMYEFHHDYVKNKLCNSSKLSFTDTDNLMYEIKMEDAYEDFSKDKKMFNFSNFSAKSKYYDYSNKLVFGKMKDKTGGVAIEELVGLKPKMYSFLLNDSSDHKKAKSVNKNFFEEITHSKYKYFFLITLRLKACVKMQLRSCHL